MAIRFLLVSLVAGLGFEPPSATDVAGWAKSGQAWVLARIDDFKGAAIVADRARSDAEFDTVVTDMKDGFAVDLAATERSKPKAELVFEPIEMLKKVKTGLADAYDRVLAATERSKPKAQLVFEPIEMLKKVKTRLADTYDRASEGVRRVVIASNVSRPISELVGPPVIELVGPPVALAHAVPVAVPTETEPARINRLASAVRLTRQAALAWMTLLHDTDTSVVRR